MPPRTRGGALLLRAAAALRRAGAVLARLARRGGERPDETRLPGKGDGAFLSQVQETLLEISAGPREAPAEPGPAATGTAAGWRAALRRPRALLEQARRHEDRVLVTLILVGIAVMVLHWVR